MDSEHRDNAQRATMAKLDSVCKIKFPSTHQFMELPRLLRVADFVDFSARETYFFM